MATKRYEANLNAGQKYDSAPTSEDKSEENSETVSGAYELMFRRGGSLPRNSGIPETETPQNGNGNRGGYRYRPSNGLMLMQSDDSGPPIGP